MILCNGFTLEIIKAHGKRIGEGWVIKAIVNGKARYRFYHYKSDAKRNLSEWSRHDSVWNFDRDFYHNFFSSIELGMEVKLGDCDKPSW